MNSSRPRGWITWQSKMRRHVLCDFQESDQRQTAMWAVYVFVWRTECRTRWWREHDGMFVGAWRGACFACFVTFLVSAISVSGVHARVFLLCHSLCVLGVFSYTPDTHIAFCPIFVYPLFRWFEPHIQKWVIFVRRRPSDFPKCQTIIIVRVCVTASPA